MKATKTTWIRALLQGKKSNCIYSRKHHRALWKIHEAEIKITQTHRLISLIVKCNLIDCRRSGSSLPKPCEQRFDEIDGISQHVGAPLAEQEEKSCFPPASNKPWITSSRILPFLGVKPPPFPHPLFWQLWNKPSLEWNCFPHTEFLHSPGLLQEAPAHHPHFKHKFKSCPWRISLSQELHHNFYGNSSELVEFSHPRHLIWWQENRNCRPRFTKGTCTALLNRHNSTHFTAWLNSGHRQGWEHKPEPAGASHWQSWIKQKLFNSSRHLKKHFFPTWPFPSQKKPHWKPAKIFIFKYTSWQWVLPLKTLFSSFSAPVLQVQGNYKTKVGISLKLCDFPAFIPSK